MSRAEEFEELRPLLFSLAYRILGSVTEAEDAVQETWLRYDLSPTRPASTRAFLSVAVTRISIDVLRSARARREEYVGPWFPEPLLEDPYEDPEHSAELADSLSTASLLLLERLSPLERAVFELREVFAFGFPEIASAVGRSEPACRQLAVRARRHMDAGRPRFEAGRKEREELAERFFAALKDGDVDGLRRLLAADVQLVADSGGKAPQWSGGLFGVDHVSGMLAVLLPPFVGIGGVIEPRRVNGRPGAVFRDREGRVVNTWSLDILGGRIQAIRTVTNPDELTHLGPVADAWALLRATHQARLESATAARATGWPHGYGSRRTNTRATPPTSKSATCTTTHCRCWTRRSRHSWRPVAGRTPGAGPSASARTTPSSSSRPSTTPPRRQPSPTPSTTSMRNGAASWSGTSATASFGAVMAVQKLRAQAGVLRMADIGPQVALTLREDFVNFTEFRPRELHVSEAHGLVDELLTWTRALAPLRAVSGATV